MSFGGLTQGDFISLLLHTLITKLINHCLDEKIRPRELSMDLSTYDFFDTESVIYKNNESNESIEKINKAIEIVHGAGFDTSILPNIKKIICNDVNEYSCSTKNGKKQPTDILIANDGCSIRDILSIIYRNRRGKARFYDTEGFTIKNNILEIKLGWLQ